jgi:hypothetical protein
MSVRNKWLLLLIGLTVLTLVMVACQASAPTEEETAPAAEEEVVQEEAAEEEMEPVRNMSWTSLRHCTCGSSAP